MAARKNRSARRSGSRGWVSNRGTGLSPWRPLVFLAVVIAGLYATMFGIGDLTPKLGIDLAGGTSAVYTASPPPGQHTIQAGALGTAVTIMQERVNAFGVSEATVAPQGSNTIEVEIPGQDSQSLINQIGTTALLYFRPVLNEAQGVATPSTSPSASGSPSASASSSATAKASSSSSATAKPGGASSSATPSEKASGQALSMTTVHDAASASSSTTAKASSSASSTAKAGSSASPGASPSASASTAPAASASETAATAAFNSLVCTDKTALKQASQATSKEYIATCDANGVKYLLGPSLVPGSDITQAIATLPTVNGAVTGAWQIDITFNKEGAALFSTATTNLYNQAQSQSGSGAFAIVLDGFVESAPTVQSPITGGQGEITGQFTEQQAQDLATQLQYGALPLNFSVSQVSIVSPTLGGSELEGGLLAGAIGLILVFLYVILYYRGLAAVAISSLFVAASLTYALATLLGPLMGFTLSLAGVAGLIVAIGITADSFVVFFERLRDEVREGRTLRTAVEHGWVRARRTIVKSDFVSFLAAAVLYEMSIGSVKGFAFTLGLTTVIDIVVVFLFTKPIISLIGNTAFFGGGHKWSGLDPARLGGKPGAWAAAQQGKRMTIADRRRAEQAAADGDDVQSGDDTKRVEA